MSRSIAAKHLRIALGRWPKDVLRPEAQVQTVVAKQVDRLESSTTATTGLQVPSTEETNALRQANALYALLDNRFRNRYALQGRLLKPRSNPSYYDDVVNELDALPTRTVLDRMVNRLSGMFRWR